jgi:alkanesulfonate monooxygenase SsuD/methylene tetrahydromethanopterin reductase-like flavin-dependent oxidoreductase (luciferase family)
VLSTDDPARVFERFSTLNALSHGRAEVLVGRARAARVRGREDTEATG